jgi:ComEC/Rec2-related protein
MRGLERGVVFVVGVALSGVWCPSPLSWWAGLGGICAVTLRAPHVWLLWGLWFWAGFGPVSLRPEGPAWSGEYAVTGQVASTYGRCWVLKVDQSTPLGGFWTQGPQGDIWVCGGEERPGRGDQVRVAGHASPYKPRSRPGRPSALATASRRKIHTHMKVRRMETLVLGQPETQRVKEDRTGVLTALTLGDRTWILSELMARLRRTGTAHVLSISGFHVGLVMWVGFRTTAFALRGLAVRWPCGVDDRLAWIAGTACAWAYVASVGFPVSGCRAAWMCTWATWGKLLLRPLSPERVLVFAAVSVLVLSPEEVGLPSFQLSFGAVSSLVLYRAWIGASPSRWARGFRASVVAWAGTIPACAWWFGEVSWVAPVANLWVMPVIALGVAPCAGFASWGPEPLRRAAARLGSWFVERVYHGLGFMDVSTLPVQADSVSALLLLALVWAPGALYGLRSLARRAPK